MARQLDDRPAQFDLLTLLVWPASMTGQARLAAQLLGAAGGVQAQAAAGLTGPFEPLLATARQTVIDALGVSGFEAAFAAGQRMALDDALRLALGETPPADVADHAPPGRWRHGRSRSPSWSVRGSPTSRSRVGCSSPTAPSPPTSATS